MREKDAKSALKGMRVQLRKLSANERFVQKININYFYWHHDCFYPRPGRLRYSKARLRDQVLYAKINVRIIMKLGSGMQGVGWSGQAFTRIDLIVLVFIVCLGVAFANPLFTSHSRARSDTLACQANLAQIGRAFHIWGNDCEDRYPFMVSTNEGGLRGYFLSPNTFIHFASLSNALGTAKLLACPADTNTVRRAKDFSASTDGGLLNPAYRNSAVSYFVGVHAQHHLPRELLGGDRNIEPRVVQGCSIVIHSAHAIESYDNGGSRWAEQIHGARGNLLFSDGSVEETTTAELRYAVRHPEDDLPGGLRGSTHVLFPK
jgi:prepilin-type processing-associated H-X9-DG protein